MRETTQYYRCGMGARGSGEEYGRVAVAVPSRGWVWILDIEGRLPALLPFYTFKTLSCSTLKMDAHA